MLLAEEIMQAVVGLLETSVDAAVFRGRVDPLAAAQLPAVGVFQGADDPADEDGRLNLGFMDELLEVRTEVAARSIEANVETDLNELRRQVHKLLLADNALGLAYVINIIPAGADEPNIDGTSEQYTGTMVLHWIVHYRHRHDDAGYHDDAGTDFYVVDSGVFVLDGGIQVVDTL